MAAASARTRKAKTHTPPPLPEELYKAIEKRDSKRVKELLKAGVSTDPSTFNTPILKCLDHYHREIFLMLLKKTNPNYKREGTLPLPLIRAIQKGNTDAVYSLVMNGAIIDNIDTIETPTGNVLVSPLTYAIRLNNLEMVKFLISIGANVNFDGHVEKVATHNYTTYNRGNGVIERWYNSDNNDNNNDNDNENENNEAPLGVIHSPFDPIRPTYRGFRTALQTAMDLNNREMTDYLLSVGARFSIYNYIGKSAGLLRTGLAFDRRKHAVAAWNAAGSATTPVTGGGSVAAGKRRRLTRRKLRR